MEVGGGNYKSRERVRETRLCRLISTSCQWHQAGEGETGNGIEEKQRQGNWGNVFKYKPQVSAGVIKDW